MYFKNNNYLTLHSLPYYLNENEFKRMKNILVSKNLLTNSNACDNMIISDIIEFHDDLIWEYKK